MIEQTPTVTFASGARLAPERFRAAMGPHLAGVSSQAARKANAAWKRDLYEDCRQHVAMRLLAPESVERMAREYDLERYGLEADRLRGFLFPRALGEARHFLRHQGRASRWLVTTGKDMEGLLDTARDDGAASASPLDELCRREEQERREALADRAELLLRELPPDQRQAFEWVVLRGWTRTAVATLLDRDRKTIAAWIRDAELWLIARLG